MSGIERWVGTLHELDRATWMLAAIVAAHRDGDRTARAVIELLGPMQSLAGEEAEQLAAAAAALLLQAAGFVTGGSAWNDQDDEALMAQGRASAGAGTFFPERVLPQLPESERLLTRPVRLLDVGVGVAAMAVALCRHMPQVSIIGLDVLDRPLSELARLHVEEAALDERIELRRLDVAELDAADEFDLAWLPAPFIPRPALERGLARVAVALRPGGWVLLGHGRLGENAMDAAITRFKTVAYGGTPLNDGEAEALLANVGLVDVHHLLTPPGAPALAVGRSPSQARASCAPPALPVAQSGGPRRWTPDRLTSPSTALCCGSDAVRVPGTGMPSGKDAALRHATPQTPIRELAVALGSH